jgi:hypothetical protein
MDTCDESMVELSMVRDVVAIVGVLIGFTYYVITVRNAQRIQQQQLETRQFQLYHTSMLSLTNMEFMNAWLDVMYHQEWGDYEEFMQKYGPIANPEAQARFGIVGSAFQHLGVLVEVKALDPDIVYKRVGGNIMRTWEKVEPAVQGIRTQHGIKHFWRSFEHLYHEFKQIEQREQSAVP